MQKGRDNKPHIGIFGRRNNGKSSLINQLAGQNVAIVSDTPGTTTDPVKKSVEIAGIGPCILIDTAGIDDSGDLGILRVKKTLEILPQIDYAILVIAFNQFDQPEKMMIDHFNKLDIPFCIIHNQSDLEKMDNTTNQKLKVYSNIRVIDFSTKDDNHEKLIKIIREGIPSSAWKQQGLLGDLVSYGDIVLLITPIDIEAPEGRLILPQVQTIRDTLDNDCIAVVCKEKELDSFLRRSGIKPKLAITDSQVFLKADAMIPRDIPLTGFSVLLARYKGDFENYLKGTPKISELKNNDRVLILESCAHHVSCDDIGRVKIPRWLSQFTGKKLEFEVVSGLSTLPRPITDYAIVIQCGGCVITRKQIINRLKPAVDAGIPVTNYGMAIAWVQGIYARAISPFAKTNDNEDYL